MAKNPIGIFGDDMKKQCKRKHYALINTIAHAIDGARITSGPKVDQLRIRELSAIEALAKGRATVQEWADMVALVYVCAQMATHGVGHEAKAVCDEADGHLIAASKRYELTGRMGLTGPGLRCIRDLYEYHDLQRTSISLSAYERHIAATANWMRSQAPEVSDVAA